MSVTSLRVEGSAAATQVDDRWVMSPQSFAWDGPSIVCVVGPNGSGKTTLLKAVVGISDLHAGEIRIDGQLASDPATRAAVAYCPAVPAVFADMTVLDQCAYVARLHDAELGESWWSLIDALEVSDGLLVRRPVAFSSGERQKASLLVALARPYRLAVLDEPSSALDEASARALVAWLQQRREFGESFVVATHNDEMVEASDIVHDVRGQP